MALLYLLELVVAILNPKWWALYNYNPAMPITLTMLAACEYYVNALCPYDKADKAF
jgi:hypothetical protein